MDKALVHLGYTQLYKGKTPPEVEPDEEDATEEDKDKKKKERQENPVVPVELLENDDGVLAIRVGEEQVVRDLARLVSEDVKVGFRALITLASLFHRRTVQVRCRKFDVDGSTLEELPVMGHHDADIGDLEHNELRQLDNAMKSRLNDVVESFTRAEGTQGFKVKRVFRYKRELKKPKFSNPRMARLMTQLERCESFDVVTEGEQHIVKLVLAGGAKSLSYVKPEEVEELEKALEGRPELQRRRAGAD
ncbi:MAG: hypothetical protein KDK70_17930 [Myxococcales bacterium]|nr:hypothetical protein [Myxococcales bacterium]